MSFAQALVVHIEANWTDAPIYFGKAISPDKPYTVMQIVAPVEQPNTLCEEQGSVGETLFQFVGAAESHNASYNLLESLKTFVAEIAGTIEYDDVTYRIEENRTDGVRQFDEALGTWSHLFESTFGWSVA